MAQNPIGSTVVTAAADETLRFWSIFESSVRMEKVVGTCLPQGISFNYR